MTNDREDGPVSTPTPAPQEDLSKANPSQAGGRGQAHQGSQGADGSQCSAQIACAPTLSDTAQTANSTGKELDVCGTEYSDSSEDDNQWMPGRVRDIFVGGATHVPSALPQIAMLVLHLTGARKANQCMHEADWSHMAAGARKALDTLAVQHSHVMFLCLDVEGSPENTQFALEKIMAASSAQRRGAKPVPKSGGKWPIITLHTPPSLQPTLSFEGSESCRDLQKYLLSTVEQLQPKPIEDASDEEACSPEGSDRTHYDTQHQDGNINAEHHQAEEQGESHCAQAAHAVVSRCSEWHRGALDMRDCYKEAAAGHSSVMTLIIDSASSTPSHTELRQTWDQAAELHTDVVFALLDVRASESNRLLAAKLASTLQCPALLFKRSAVDSAQQGTSGDNCPEKENSKTPCPKTGQSSSCQASCRPKPAGGTVQLLQAVNVATLTKTLQRLSHIVVRKPRAAQDVAAGQKGTFGPSERRSIYDPPEGALKRPGTYKSFGKRGDAVYWPRMPCLRCGCPWWLGEDWDATCVRCKWSCEHDGYDDDSRPLRKGGWVERYERFTAFLKQGKTARWPPVPQEDVATRHSKRK